MSSDAKNQYMRCNVCGHVESKFIIDNAVDDFGCPECGKSKLSDFVHVGSPIGMSKHTPESWAIRGANNARRIAACVNACAGMADPAAEIVDLKSLSVTKIILDVAPGDGSGIEVCAKSAADVSDFLGKMDEEIAKTLHLSVYTVKKYISHLKDMTGYRNRTELAVAASRLGLVTPGY